MSIDTPFKAKLQHAVGADDTELVLDVDTADVCACLEEPSHMFATVYTATVSERILITGCDAGKLIVTRGVDGSDAAAWPACACVLIDTVVEGSVCPDLEDQEAEAASEVTAQIVTGKGLEVVDGVLQLMRPGVVPGTYGGAEVNDCGQFSFIPDGWPSVALADFDPCCDDMGAGSTATTAAQVSFAPDVGNTVATGTNVQVVLQQIDDYLTSYAPADSGVQSLIAGDCIEIGGTTANPTVSVATGAISPGVYAGFTVNSCGIIEGYTAPPSENTVVVGTAPVSVAFDGSMTYTVSVAAATKTTSGVVVLADEADIATNQAGIAGDRVITWDFLQLWQATNNAIANVVAGHDAVLVGFNGVDTYTITLPADLITGTSPITIAVDGASGKFLVEVLEAAVGQKGVVCLADVANVSSPASNDPDDVVTSEYLETWAAARGI